MVGRGAKEIDVRIDALGSHLSLHDVLDLGGHLIETLISRVGSNLLGKRLQIASAWVIRLVDAVPKAHDPILASKALLDVRLHIFHGADFIEHMHHFFVCSTMQRSLQRADGRGDGAVHIAEGANGDARSKGAGIQAMVSVQDQADIKCLRNGDRRACAIQHVQEVGGHVHRCIRTDEWLALAMAIEVGNDGWRLRQEAH